MNAKQLCVVLADKFRCLSLKDKYYEEASKYEQVLNPIYSVEEYELLAEYLYDFRRLLNPTFDAQSLVNYWFMAHRPEDAFMNFVRLSVDIAVPDMIEERRRQAHNPMISALELARFLYGSTGIYCVCEHKHLENVVNYFYD